MQKAVFKHFPELQKFALANVSSIDRKETLIKHFKTLRFVQSCCGCDCLEMLKARIQDVRSYNMNVR